MDLGADLGGLSAIAIGRESLSLLTLILLHSTVRSEWPVTVDLPRCGCNLTGATATVL